MGEYTLEVPSQGPTSAARLALARQGCATGSFRLNCSESLYVIDEMGRAMFERIQLEEELEAGLHGLMEKPPMRDSQSTSRATLSPISTGLSPPPGSVQPLHTAPISSTTPGAPTLGRKMTTRRVATFGGDNPRRRTSARRRKPIPSSMDMRFNSSGLSSCATFTEGLCELDDYADLKASAYDKPTARLSASFSAHEIGGNLPLLETVAWNLTWLGSSLKKHSLPKKGGTKKKDIFKSSLAKSLSSWDITSSFVENGNFPSLNPSEQSAITAPAPVLTATKAQKRRPRAQELANSVKRSSSESKLPRDGSWSKLRKKIAYRSALEQTTTYETNESTPSSTLSSSVSISGAIFFMTQRGISVTGCAGFERSENRVDRPALY